MYGNLNSEEYHHLLKLLQKYEHLFDGILGEFNMDPISLYLPEKGVKLVHAWPNTVPRAVEQQLCTDIARLVDIGVLEEDYTSEQASQHFLLFLRITELQGLFLTSNTQLLT
jgi:hypothetical protein